MIKAKYAFLSLMSAGVLSLGAISVASADNPSSATKSTTFGTSGISRTTFKQDSLNASAQVLNTTTANIKAAHKSKTFSQLLSKAGLTKKTYAQKVKALLTTELEGQGYSQDQVTIALQHRSIVRLRHHDK